MQPPKSADQIQAELALIRLAYHDRCDHGSLLNQRRIHPLAHAAPYLISAGLVAIFLTVVLGIFL